MMEFQEANTCGTCCIIKYNYTRRTRIKCGSCNSASASRKSRKSSLLSNEWISEGRKMCRNSGGLVR